MTEESTVDKAGFQDWLDRYVEAWKSYDPEAIGDLFSADVLYKYHPLDEGTRGRDEVVKDWTDKLAQRSPTAIALAKRSFNADLELPPPREL